MAARTETSAPERSRPESKTIEVLSAGGEAAWRKLHGLKLLSGDMVAIDGSKFKAVNSRDRSYTSGKFDNRQQQIEESVQRYLDLIETADRTSQTGFDVKTVRLY